jgi:C-methyltransferase-like protein/putative zinc binding protein/methyltransferase family protein
VSFEAISQCRICGNRHLERVLDLGEQMLTGVFPREKDAHVTVGPLRLVLCSGGDDVCNLLQLEHTYDLPEMYGMNYGYRSGLNPSMVKHLRGKVERILGRISLQPNDLVIDIGSNDSTTLQSYPEGAATFVGIDPTGIKFKQYYPPHIALIPDFFSADLVRQRFGDRKAKIVTSFSMFYDLPAPMAFMQQVHDVLADDGIWIFEQSYMPTMLATNSYDTVCHEHLEFYGLRQIQWMCARVGFEIRDVEFNDVNGGSFSVTVAKRSGTTVRPEIQKILDLEREEGLHTSAPYLAFAQRVDESRDRLRAFLANAHAKGQSVAALGASTKGNVLLQYCGLTAQDIESIGEVNPDKYGSFAPGTWIPIIPEDELFRRAPDYLLVLPWHFRKFFEGSPRFASVNLVFPLPELDVVEARHPAGADRA